jgi:hypothetical protein
VSVDYKEERKKNNIMKRSRKTNNNLPMFEYATLKTLIVPSN